jgi:hypothetical protein
VPELWYPDTGKIEEAASYSFTKDGRMSVPLSLDPSGSVFVVFRESTDSEKKAFDEVFESSAINGSWILRFPKGWGAPEQIKLDKLIDWTDHNDYDIKHFSGTATYIKDFDFSASGKSKSAFLDLGTVNVMAEVKLNGKNLGILWKPPFKVEITDAVKNGSNHLEIEVVNLWVNRLIGDEKYPDDCKWGIFRSHGKEIGWQISKKPQWLTQGKPRPQTERKTFATFKWYKADAPLLPSGLLGPVRIIQYKTNTLE